jgi:hypothetical protein
VATQIGIGPSAVIKKCAILRVNEPLNKIFCSEIVGLMF